MSKLIEYRLINYNKYATLVWEVDTVLTGGQKRYVNSLLSAQFCYEPKTTLKNKI